MARVKEDYEGPFALFTVWFILFVLGDDIISLLNDFFNFVTGSLLENEPCSVFFSYLEVFKKLVELFFISNGVREINVNRNQNRLSILMKV